MNEYVCVANCSALSNNVLYKCRIIYSSEISSNCHLGPNNAVSAVHKQPRRIVLKDAVTQKKRIILSLMTTLLPLHHTKKIINTMKDED